MEARKTSPWARVVTHASLGMLAMLALASRTGAAAPAPTTRASSAVKKTVAAKASLNATARTTIDSSMTLKGGEEGTVFRTLTVQGEDRIHIEVERPVLRLDMDPEKAPGLERGDVKDVLERTTPDLEAPLRAASAREPARWVAHPWLSHFPEGAVARMRPDVRGVERWRLVIVNARAESVAVFQGKGDPPREISWDGRAADGAPVLPGASYSYVFEARDKAGNKRNFVGEGFRVNAFRYGTTESPVLVFSGQELIRAAGAAAGLDDVPPIILQAATIVNQTPVGRSIQVVVTARSADEATALGQRITRWLAPLVIGEPTRVHHIGVVRSDAPIGAAVRIAMSDDLAGED